MPVNPRGSSWQAQVYFKGKRYRRNFKTVHQAVIWEKETKKALLAGKTVITGRSLREEIKALKSDTLLSLVEHVYASHWIVQSGGSRQRLNALSIIKHIGPSLAVKNLTRSDIDKARATLLTTDAPATVNRKVAALSKCLSIYADDHPGYVKPKLAKYRESEGRIRRFTTSEEQQAFAYFSFMGNQDMADYVALSLDTGLRQGEARQLRFIDCDSQKLTVWGSGVGEQRTKSGKSRSVPLTARVRAILQRRARELSPEEPRVFPLLTSSRIAHYWGRFSEAIKMQDDPAFVPHILRHEFCSRLADLGVHITIIKELAGHSTLTVTERYIHLQATSLMDAITKLERETKFAAPDIKKTKAISENELQNSIKEISRESWGFGLRHGLWKNR